jgi:hypothetical protein
VSSVGARSGILALGAGLVLATALVPAEPGVRADRARSTSGSTSSTRFRPAAFSVPVGRPIVIEIHNGDPIDHEWIVGDEATISGMRPAPSPPRAATDRGLDRRRGQRDHDRRSARPASSATSAICRATRQGMVGVVTVSPDACRSRSGPGSLPARVGRLLDDRDEVERLDMGRDLGASPPRRRRGSGSAR